MPTHLKRYKGNPNAVCNTVVLPQNLLSTPHILIEDFENAADWSAWCSNDVANYRTGTQSVKFTTASGGANSADKIGLSLDFSAMAGDGVVRVYVYVVDTTKISNISFNLGNDAGTWTNFYKRTLTASALVNGWNAINVIPSQLSPTGSPSWLTTIKRIRIAVTAQTGEVAIVSWDSLYVGIRGKAAVLITFDDVWETAYTEGFSYMKTFGIRGTGYIITDRVNLATYCTLAELTEMYSSGWCMANHTKDHTVLTGLTQAQQEAEFTNAQIALIGWGFTNGDKYVAYIQGLFDDTTKAAMTATGMRTGRTVRNQNEILPFSHPYELKTWSTGNTVTLANRIVTVDNAIARGEIAQMHFHKLVTSPSDSTEWGIADFHALMNYIRTESLLGLIYPITVNDLYNLTLGPVRVPKVR